MEVGRFNLVERGSTLTLAALLLAAGLAAATKSKTPSALSDQNRLAIVRFLAFEYATARQPMPASKEVKEAVTVDGSGQINQDKLREDLAKRGAAIYTGEKIQITKITFFNDRIIFDINGGGKRKKKWSERIQVEAGGSGIPVPTVEKLPPADPSAEPIRAGFGSWITLAFPQGLPDLTADQVKGLLAGVLDFEARSAARAWIETIPEQFREPIKERRAIAGMSREMVLAAKGRPDKKVRETRDGVEYEDWMYGNPPFTIFVTFVGDTVVEVKEFK